MENRKSNVKIPKMWHINIDGKPLCAAESSGCYRYVPLEDRPCLHCGGLKKKAVIDDAFKVRAVLPYASIHVLEGGCKDDPFWKTEEGIRIIKETDDLHEDKHLEARRSEYLTLLEGSVPSFKSDKFEVSFAKVEAAAKDMKPVGWKEHMLTAADTDEIEAKLTEKAAKRPLEFSATIISSSVLSFRARSFAHHAHEFIAHKRRYTGDPYWHHTDAVAALVTVHGGTQYMIAAAHLHDVLEDVYPKVPFCNAILLTVIFGAHVQNLVTELTDIYTPENYPDMNRKQRKEMEAQRLGQVSTEAKIIKLADICDNTKDIVANDPGFAKTYLREKEALLDALAIEHPLMVKAREQIRQ